MSHRRPDTIEMFPDMTPEAKVVPATPDTLEMPTVDQKIWRYIRDQGETGATVFEVDTALALVGLSTAGARIRMLVRAGSLRDTGRRRVTTGKHTARVYTAVIPRDLAL